MKILLFGKNGQVGWELQRALAPLGELISLDRNGEGGLCGDLTQLGGVAATIKSVAPDVIVNSAAYTAVDQAESAPELTNLVNSDAVHVMAKEAANLGALFVHYSTEYVFNGSGSAPWRETDTTAPLSVYGHSKLSGEQAIFESGCRYLIFRTSWAYAARGNNFAKIILRLAANQEEINVIADQIGAPTGADLISDITAHAIRAVSFDPTLSGLYHLAATGETSRYDYARYIIELARSQGRILKVINVNPIPTSHYATPAQRPLNSRLDSTKLAELFGLYLPHWTSGVRRMLSELKENSV